jgi:serine/threonine-protein kinase
VINTVGDDPPAASQEAFAVDTRTETASYQVNVDVSAQIVQVSGSPVADALNAALRKPVDDEIADVRKSVDSLRDDMRESGDDRWDDPVSIDVKATVLLRNPDYVSVRYDNQPTLGPLTNSSWQSFDTVTVDLRTGKALTLDQLYRPGAAAALSDALFAEYADELCPTISTGETRVDITEESLGKYVVVAFAGDHAEFTIELSNFDRATACGVLTYELPYEKLTQVLRPELVRGLTGG